MNTTRTAVRTNCEVCAGPGNPWLEKGPRRLVRCRPCGFTWIPDGVADTSRGLSIYEDEDFNFLAHYTEPDVGSLCSRLLGRAWYYIDLEQQVSLFSVADLTRLLMSLGLEIVDRRTFGRRYRFSYIEQRLRNLSHQSAMLRVLHGLSFPVRLAPASSVPINFGDVIGIAARIRSTGT